MEFNISDKYEQTLVLTTFSRMREMHFDDAAIQNAVSDLTAKDVLHGEYGQCGVSGRIEKFGNSAALNISLNDTCVAIRNIRTEDSQGDTVIVGDVKPTGPHGDAVKKLIDDCHPMRFAMRSYNSNEGMRVITFDLAPTL